MSTTPLTSAVSSSRHTSVAELRCYDAVVRFEALIDQTLAQLAADGLLREPDDGRARAAVAAAAAQSGQQALDASSNDYLGLAESGVSRETLGNAGSGASRLIHGTSLDHVLLETALASWVSAETSLLFSSTYAANLGLISALGVRESVIISDSGNHASLIDGARLAKAELVVVPHLDLAAIRRALTAYSGSRACWVLTESYFSMDGDGPDLAELRSICDRHDACLVVDESHALGVFGPAGSGLCAQAGVRADILVGALGKAIGTHGGFVAGSASLRTFLWNRARSFVFSTAPPPRQARLTLQHLTEVQNADRARAQLITNSNELRQRLRAAGLDTIGGSFGPIVSVVLGGNQRVLAASGRLRSRGILAQAIRPPTVPAGAARLRLTVKATFTEADIERLAAAVEDACLAS